MVSRGCLPGAGGAGAGAQASRHQRGLFFCVCQKVRKRAPDARLCMLRREDLARRAGRPGPRLLCVVSFAAIAAVVAAIAAWAGAARPAGPAGPVCLSAGRPRPPRFRFHPRWDVIRWSPGMTYDDYREQYTGMPDLPGRGARMAGWSDKIWLAGWYRRHRLAGPPMLHRSRSPAAAGVAALLRGRRDYCAKPSHLSERVGVMVVRDGKLAKDVELDRIRDTPVPAFMRRLVRGRRVAPDEVQAALRFLMTVRAIWEDPLVKYAPPGVVVEPLHDGTEIKVFVMLGSAIGHYYMAGDGFDIDEAYDLAERAATAAGIDFVRVDIVRFAGRYCISELTFNPAIYGEGRRIVDEHFHLLVDFHTNRC